MRRSPVEGIIEKKSKEEREGGTMQTGLNTLMNNYKMLLLSQRYPLSLDATLPRRPPKINQKLFKNCENINFKEIILN